MATLEKYSPGPLLRATLFKKGYPFALIRNYMDLWRVGLLLFWLTVSIIFWVPDFLDF